VAEVMIPRLLVVGGTGFIGHHLVRAGVDQNWQVTSLSLNVPKPSRRVPGVEYICADIIDKDSLQAKLSEIAFEYVVNVGGYIDHTLFLQGGRASIQAHFDALLNLIEPLDKQILKKFVQIGSSDEYGNAPAPQKEQMREGPISPYALAKTASTHFLQMLYRTEGFPAVILRPFLTYGPEQDEKRFLPQIICGCLKDESFATSAGEQLRDFCYVEDTVEAIILALQSDNANGEVFNVASGQAISIRDMIVRLQSLVRKGEPRFGEIAYRPRENMELYADISKIHQLLGWSPETSIDAGLTMTIDWFRGQL
jgi:nucleoside-diphosphate-sugar epimerase